MEFQAMWMHACLVLTFCVACFHAAEVPALFIFGDSLTDVGNNNYINSLAKADVRYNGIDYNGGVPTGRFCNGRTVPDIIGDYLGVPPPPPYLKPNMTAREMLQGVNYASGAGGILDATGANYISRISFNQQLVYFANTKQRLVQELGMDKANIFLAKSIFMVEFGANDYINNYLVTFSPTPSQYSPKQFQDLLITTYTEQLSRLYDLGARKLVIFGIGPLGCIPSQVMRTTDLKCVPLVNEYVKGFNDAVGERLSGKLLNQLPGIQFVFANGYDIFLKMIATPQSYGFKVTNQGCCGLGRLNGLLACMPISNLCTNRNEYLFWDPFHPTEAANLVLATNFFNGSSPDVAPINVQQLAEL